MTRTRRPCGWPWLAAYWLVATPTAAQESGAVDAAASAARREGLLVQWLQERESDEQYVLFRSYRDSVPGGNGKIWLVALDTAMRDFAASGAAADRALPAAAVQSLLEEVREVRGRRGALSPFLPWLLLVAKRAPDDLRVQLLVCEAFAAPGRTQDLDVAAKAAVAVLGGCDEKASAERKARRDELLGWLPELQFAAGGAGVEFLRGETKRRIDVLKGGEGFAVGDLMARRLQRLGEQFDLAVRGDDDPFELIERMRGLQAEDPVADLLYVLTACSAGRKGDDWKQCRQRFAKVWEQREKSGLDVDELLQRLRVAGVEQACSELGLAFDPGQLVKGGDELSLVFPSAAGLKATAEKAAKDAKKARDKLSSIESSISNYADAAKQARENEEKWRRRARGARNPNDRISYNERADDYRRKAEGAEASRKRRQEEAAEQRGLISRLEAIEAGVESRRRSLRN